MSALDVFQYDGRDVRTVNVAGEPWFVAADVAGILGYSVAKDMARSLDDDEKDGRPVPTPGGDQMMLVISEAGLFKALIQRQTGRMVDDARRAQVKAFQRWVTHDVLPTIRRTGRYGSDVDMLAQLPSSQMLQLAAEAAKRAEEAEHELEEARPKVEAYDAFIDADGTYSIGAVAKMIGLSQNKLFDRLRNDGVLIAKGAMRNTPYQQYMRHFAVKAYDYERSNGDRGTRYTTRVQPSGVDFIRRKLDLVAALN
ncbi:phage antirepressor [Agrococcus casei]|uniref:phage antirepressor n=1 Tax=Agrococcus casei TaxID=343512 RepID=UPI003F92E41E